MEAFVADIFLINRNPPAFLTVRDIDLYSTLQILESSLEWLNEWEYAKRRGEILPDEFLTPETSEGLRLSLMSTMGLCRYLISRHQFQYLLTGRVNQDNLEVFRCPFD